MSDLEAMLRAVLAAPDDPGPRLILADWLEEQGQEAANLYREGGWWELEGSKQQLVWYGGDEAGAWGYALWPVPEPISCQADAWKSATAPGGFTHAPCTALATRRHEGRWLCEGCYQMAHSVPPRSSILWEEVSFSAALAVANGQSQSEAILPDGVEPPGDFPEHDAHVVRCSDGTYLVHHGDRFWMGRPAREEGHD